jgi:hypothetical protein
MRARHFLFLAYATALFTVAACGGDDDDGGSTGGSTSGGKVSTGLPKTDKLSSLNDDDAQQACTSTAHAFNTILPDSKLEEIGCILVAITALIDENSGEVDSSNIAECKQITQDCLAGKPINGETIEVDTQIVDETSCEGASAGDTFSGCDATVSDYESCAGKVAGELKVRFSGISCDGLKDIAKFQESVQAEIDVSTASECKGLREKCPDLDLSGAGM